MAEETTHDCLDFAAITVISGEEIGDTMIDEVEPISSSEEVEDDPMNLEIWW